jgi:predicted component of viral defense system (DUF524 family)
MMDWNGLYIRPRREDGPQPTIRRGRLVLDNSSDWVFEGSEPQLGRLAGSLGDLVEVVGTALLVRFGNAVGTFRNTELGEFQVVSGKWRESDFHSMLLDLSHIAASLPFGPPAPGALPYDRALATHEPVLYHLFAYLRNALSDEALPEEALAPALETIVRDPHRRLVRETHIVPIGIAKRIGPQQLIDVASGRYPLARVEDRLASGAPSFLRGHLPIEVEETRTIESLDNPENRFVKMVLGLAAGILDEVERRIPPGGQAGRLVSDDCALLRARLEPYRRARLWETVGRLTQFSASSPVLQRRRGYSTVLRVYSRLRLASKVPLDGETVRRLLESRDIAELYELWCYFRFAELISIEVGEPLQASRFQVTATHLQVPWDFRILWSGGIRLYYNRFFSRAQSSSRRAYSVPLRPDLALEIPNGSGAGLHLFDAKFKLDRIDDVVPEGTASEEGLEQEERKGTFKRADLYKMHTYRDAIPRARSVWVLYPGTQERFFSAGGELDGVGAIPLLPVSDGALPSTLVSALQECL